MRDYEMFQPFQIHSEGIQCRFCGFHIPFIQRKDFVHWINVECPQFGETFFKRL